MHASAASMDASVVLVDAVRAEPALDGVDGGSRALAACASEARHLATQTITSMQALRGRHVSALRGPAAGPAEAAGAVGPSAPAALDDDVVPTCCAPAAGAAGAAVLPEAADVAACGALACANAGAQKRLAIVAACEMTTCTSESAASAPTASLTALAEVAASPCAAAAGRQTALNLIGSWAQRRQRAALHGHFTRRRPHSPRRLPAAGIDSVDPDALSTKTAVASRVDARCTGSSNAGATAGVRGCASSNARMCAQNSTKASRLAMRSRCCC